MKDQPTAEPKTESQPEPDPICRTLRITVEYSQMDVGDDGDASYPKLNLVFDRSQTVDGLMTADAFTELATKMFIDLLTRLNNQPKPEVK